MMKLVMLAAATGALFALEVRAQVTLDLSKVTCEQYVGYKITDPQNISIWLSGYFNGKRGNTIVDTQGFNERQEAAGLLFQKSCDTSHAGHRDSIQYQARLVRRI